MMDEIPFLNGKFSKPRSRNILLLVWAACLLAGSWLFCQTQTGSLTGLVKDQSGAVVPDAKIVVTNAATGIQNTAQTNSDGYYTFPLLPPGNYGLSVEKAGFKRVVRSGISLNVQETARIDFTLQLGASVQQVTVSAAAPLLQKETSSISQLVSQREVANLPLLGRNPYALVQLVPGAFVPATFNNLPVDIISTTNFSVNGARGYQNEFLLDGVPNTSPGNDGPVVYPVVDSVQEYRVTTSNYSAEYGRAAGGVFNVATKSGANEFHGNAYDYLRNSALDANDFFSNRAGLPIAPFRFNQFGGTFGGPIRKNRTFFFGDYEGVRETQGVTYSGTVPTLAERQGDFSHTFNAQGKLIQIFNPFSTVPNPGNPSQFIRSVFSGNIIPAGMIDPVARKLTQFFPSPNTPGNPVTNVGNYTSANPQTIRKDDFSIRADNEVSDKQRLFAEFFYDRSPWVRPSAYGEPDPGSPSFGPQLFQRRAVVLNDTYDFSPTTIGNFSYGFNRLTNVRYPFSYGFNLTSLGFPATFAAQQQTRSIPTMNIAGFGGNFSVANTGDNGVTLGNTSLIVFGIDSHTWQGEITKIRGRHTLKFGGQVRLMRQNPLQAPDNNGFTFTPNFTQGPNPTVASPTAGFSLASFLLGTPASGSVVTAPALALQTIYDAAYIEDDFKFTPKLTLNLGLRYEYESPWTDRFNQLTNFNFQETPPLKAPGRTLRGALSFVGVDGNPRKQWNSDFDNVSPRIGFAYSPRAKTVLRGGAGIFYSPTFGAANWTAVSGFSSTTSFVGSLNGVTPFNVLSNPFPQGLLRPPGSTEGPATLLGQTVVFADRNMQTPYAISWNFQIQRQLPGDSLFTIGYVGSRGLELYNNLSLNQLPDNALAQGNALLTLVANPFYGQISSGILRNPKIAEGQLLRPFPQFDTMTALDSTWASSTYHALQVEFEKRFSHGFNITASYTWSKLMDNTTGAFNGQPLSGTAFQNNNNHRAEWAVSSLDLPQRFVVGYMWELPFGPEKRFLTNGWLSRVLGGWQAEGITTVQSGEILGVTDTTNTTFSNGGGQRPNWNGVNPAIGNPTVNNWFNTAVFSQPPSFTFGSAPRTFGSLQAAPIRNFDFSMIKDTKLSERFALQFRAECFNLFNRVQFAPPDTVFNTPNFGVVTSQLNSARIIQFALKLMF